MQRLGFNLIAIGSLVACTAAQAPSDRVPASAFKVATWNIRSGMGIRGFATTAWSHDTLNCHDRLKPMNAWGIGLPQAELERLRDDGSIVGLAVQEAWNCAAPDQINAVLGFRSATRQEEGVLLLARHGFAGSPRYHRLDAPSNRWMIGADVCLDPGCGSSVSMYSTHFGGRSDDEIPAQAERALAFLEPEGRPHLFMGDLNVFRSDAWNPPVPCTGPDHPARVRTIDAIEAAGYIDVWKRTQSGAGWTGMASRRGCGSPEGGLYKRIDYVYVKGLRVLAAARFAVPPPGGDAASDHVGVVATLAPPE